MDLSLSNPSVTGPETLIEERANKVRAELKDLERRDWWLWSLAVVVMLLLTLAVVTLSFPNLLKVDDPFFQFSQNRAVRGLVILVLLFNAYTVYQQATIKRLRRQFSKQLDEMGALQTRAEEFHRLATTDPLTGLANRRSAKQRLLSEVARAGRHGYPLTLLAFDLDNFKQINDRHGHAAGDAVLREFGERLATTIRLSDLAVRMGGDEFLAMLPQCPADQIPALLERMRALEVEYNGVTFPVEFSVGYVSYEQGETPEEFLERADQTLYQDKRESKSRVGDESKYRLEKQPA